MPSKGPCFIINFCPETLNSLSGIIRQNWCGFSYGFIINCCNLTCIHFVVQHFLAKICLDFFYQVCIIFYLVTVSGKDDSIFSWSDHFKLSWLLESYNQFINKTFLVKCETANAEIIFPSTFSNNMQWKQ